MRYIKTLHAINWGCQYVWLGRGIRDYLLKYSIAGRHGKGQGACSPVTSVSLSKVRAECQSHWNQTSQCLPGSLDIQSTTESRHKCSADQLTMLPLAHYAEPVGLVFVSNTVLYMRNCMLSIHEKVHVSLAQRSHMQRNPN